MPVSLPLGLGLALATPLLPATDLAVRRTVPPPGARPVRVETADDRDPDASTDAATSAAETTTGDDAKAETGPDADTKDAKGTKGEASADQRTADAKAEASRSSDTADGGSSRSRPASRETDASETGPSETDPDQAERRSDSGRGLSWSFDDDAPPERRFMLGLEGVVIQAPPLRPQVVQFDPRFLGRSVSLGGLGLFGRFGPHPRIAIELGVRSGSLRYAARDGEDDHVVSQDQVMVDAGVLLWVARGEMARLGFDAGVGGMGSRVRYELDRNGTQVFGSGLVRVGADAEFLFKRVAFVISVRTYGVLTDLDRVRSRGSLLESRGSLRAPVPSAQTYLVASGGVAYRF